jgi:hypothetical protein
MSIDPVIIVCYAKCSPCQFGECEPGPHTWMESEDLDHAGIPTPTSPEGWLTLAAEKPCGCRCQKRASAVTEEWTG